MRKKSDKLLQFYPLENKSIQVEINFVSIYDKLSYAQYVDTIEALHTPRTQLLSTLTMEDLYYELFE